jgi:hypothetical protein
VSPKLAGQKGSAAKTLHSEVLSCGTRGHDAAGEVVATGISKGFEFVGDPTEVAVTQWSAAAVSIGEDASDIRWHLETFAVASLCERNRHVTRHEADTEQFHL